MDGVDPFELEAPVALLEVTSRSLRRLLLTAKTKPRAESKHKKRIVAFILNRTKSTVRCAQVDKLKNESAGRAEPFKSTFRYERARTIVGICRYAPIRIFILALLCTLTTYL